METIRKEELKNANNKTYQDAKQFIARMKKLGIYKKQEYNLPLRDTIGKRLIRLNKFGFRLSSN